MSQYTDRVEAGLKGLEAVSTGLCGGCMECASASGFTRGFDEDGQEHLTEHILEAFEQAVRSGKAHDEGSFSWSECGICGNRLGGNRYVWHAVSIRPGGADGAVRELLHFDDACTDCVVYLANGDEPDPA